jgi:hypothetical protein
MFKVQRESNPYKRGKRTQRDGKKQITRSTARYGCIDEVTEENEKEQSTQKIKKNKRTKTEV